MRMGLVFVDANVLYSRTLRDWTLLLSRCSGRFTVVTSRDVLVEVLANLREMYPEKDGGWIEMIHQKITESVHDVITDWPGGAVEGLADPKDWHVVNAAIHPGLRSS